MQLLVEGAGKLGQTFSHNIKEKKGGKLQEMFKQLFHLQKTRILRLCGTYE